MAVPEFEFAACTERIAPCCRNDVDMLYARLCACKSCPAENSACKVFFCVA